MKSTNLIWPLLTMAAFVIVLLSLFVDFMNFVTPLTTTGSGIFTDYGYMESAFLVTIGLVAIIVSLVALALSGLLMLLKKSKSKSKNKGQKVFANILKLLLVLMVVAIVVAFVLFFNANTTTLLTVTGGVGFYFAAIGTGVGALSAIIGLRK